MAKTNKELLKESEQLFKENKLLHRQLREATQTHGKIKTENIDALVVRGKKNLKVFTETSADKTYRILIEKMHEGAVILNMEGIILYCNSSFARMIKLSLQKVIGSVFKNYVTDFSARLFERLVKKAGNNTPGEEFYLHSSDGNSIPVLLSLNKLRLNNSFIFSIVVTDLILQKRNQEELKDKASQLERINKELGIANKNLISFAYVSSHDLQEPLRKIQIYVSLIQEEEKNLSDAGRGYFERMSFAAKRAQGLIEDLVMYSGSSSAGQKFQTMDIGIIIDQVKKVYDKKMKEMNAVIELYNPCEVNIIAVQFRKIIDSLISNTLKFSRIGVKPLIKIKCEIIHGNRLKKLKLSSKIDYCHIIYTDNGIGFDPQYNVRIFEIFQRLHRKEEYEGTGIGLAICKRIIENHKGAMTGSGKLNKEARFDIYIPSIETGNDNS